MSSAANRRPPGAGAGDDRRPRRQRDERGILQQLMCADYDIRDSHLFSKLPTANGTYTDGTGHATDVGEAVLDDSTAIGLPAVGNKHTFTKAATPAAERADDRRAGGQYPRPRRRRHGDRRQGQNPVEHDRRDERQQGRSARAMAARTLLHDRPRHGFGLDEDRAGCRRSRDGSRLTHGRTGVRPRRHARAVRRRGVDRAGQANGRQRQRRVARRRHVEEQCNPQQFDRRLVEAGSNNSGASFTASLWIAAEGAAAPTFTWTGSVACSAPRSLIIRDPQNGPAGDGFGQRDDRRGTTATHTSTGFTSDANDALAVYADAAAANTAIATPAGWTEDVDAGSATDAGRTAFGNKAIATSGTAAATSASRARPPPGCSSRSN
jgi:hypothetical protein